MKIVDTLIPDSPLMAKNVIPYGAQMVKTFVMTDLAGTTGNFAVDDVLTKSSDTEECVVLALDAANPTWMVVQQTSVDKLVTGTYNGPTGSTIVQALYERSITSKIEVRCRIYVEDVPGSGNYDFVTQLKGFSGSDGWVFFHLHGILDDDKLEYASVTIDQANYLDERVCRNIKAEFYEYNPSEHVLYTEGYHEDDSIPLIEIPELTDDLKYRMVIKTDDEDLVDQVYICNDDDTLRVNHSTAGYVNDIQGDETHKLIETADGSTYKYLHMPPNVKVEIYTYPNDPTSGLIEPVYTVPAVRFALKGGIDNISRVFGSEEYLGTPDGQFIETPDGQKILFI